MYIISRIGVLNLESGVTLSVYEGIYFIHKNFNSLFFIFILIVSGSYGYRKIREDLLLYTY